MYMCCVVKVTQSHTINNSYNRMSLVYAINNSMAEISEFRGQ